MDKPMRTVIALITIIAMTTGLLLDTTNFYAFASENAASTPNPATKTEGGNGGGTSGGENKPNESNEGKGNDGSDNAGGGSSEQGSNNAAGDTANGGESKDGDAKDGESSDGESKDENSKDGDSATDKDESKQSSSGDKQKDDDAKDAKKTLGASGANISLQAVPGDNVTSTVDMANGETKTGNFTIGNNGVVRGPTSGTAKINDATVANEARNDYKGGYSSSNGSALIARGAKSLELNNVTINSGLNTLVLNIWENASINANNVTLNGSANNTNDTPFLMVGKYPDGAAGTLNFSGDSTIFAARGSVVGSNNNSVINVESGTLTIKYSDIAFKNDIMIVVKSGATLNIVGSDLTGVCIKNGGTLNITDSKLHDSTRNSQETMIHTDGEGTTTNITNSEIYNNRNTMPQGNPGASVIKIENGTLNLSGAKVHDNRCETRGGAIYLSNSTLSIDDKSEFKNNSAQFLGGAIYMTGTTATIGASTFSNNGYQSAGETTHQGGAIYAEGGSTITLNGTKFDSNYAWNGQQSAGENGTAGALYLIGAESTLKIFGAKFTNNTAYARGGGLAVANSSHTEISDLDGDPTEFTGNTVTNGVDFAGGGMFVDTAFVKVWDTAVYNNTAPDGGGGLSTCSVGTAQVWSQDGGAIFGNDVSNASAGVADSEVSNYKDLYILTKDHRDLTTGEKIPGRGGFSNEYEFELVERMFNGGLHRWSLKNFATAESGHSYHSLIAQSDPTNKDVSAAKVVFTNNTVSKGAVPGAVTGGGIACNGLIEMGTTTEIKVVKVWEDGNDVDAYRPTPEQFKNDIKILANGVELSDEAREQLQIDVMDLKDHPFVFSDNVVDPFDRDQHEDYSDKDAWIAVISNLPHTNEDGTTIEYTVEELPVPGYTQTRRSGREETHFEFTNSHTPGERFLTNVTLEATKTLAGRELEENEFSFELRNADGHLIETKSCDANGVVVFDQLLFDRAGTYDYYVTEVAGEDERMTYDTSEHRVRVEVTAAEDHSLTARTSYTRNGDEVADVAFQNTYTPERTYEKATAGLELTKTLEGSVLEDGQFTFHLYGATGELLQTKKNDVNGIVLFDDLTFSAPGTYVYQIREDADNPVITYDGAYHVVTFHVHDEGNGKLKVTKSIELDGKDVDSPSFHNVIKNAPTYTPVPVQIEAAKTLEGEVLEAGQFSFNLDDADGKTLQTKTCDANGVVLFDAVNFNEEGTYTYRVREVAGDDALTTYDGKVHVVTIDVVAGADGQLTATTHVTVDGDEVDALAFDNIYDNGKTYAPIKVAVEAHKTLTGKALAADEFSFKLDGAEGQTIQTKKNDGSGLVAFDAIEISKPGTYVYTITEEQGNEANVTYDKRSYLATVRVREAANGTLAADDTVYTLLGEETKTATFENTYGGSGGGGGVNPQPRYTAARTTTTRAATPKTADATLPAGLATLIGAAVTATGLLRRRK